MPARLRTRSSSSITTDSMPGKKPRCPRSRRACPEHVGSGVDVDGNGLFCMVPPLSPVRARSGQPQSGSARRRYTTRTAGGATARPASLGIGDDHADAFHRHSTSRSSASGATTSAVGSTRRTHAVIGAAIDAGVTLFDTPTSTAAPAARSSWQGTRHQARPGRPRHQVRHPLRGTRGRAAAGYVARAVEDSLRRLGPTASTSTSSTPRLGGPVAETLGALNDLVVAGKVRVIGCSNFTRQLREASGGRQGCPLRERPEPDERAQPGGRGRRPRRLRRALDRLFALLPAR